MTYDIQSMQSIPKPKRGRTVIYPFASLQIGQCFRIPAEQKDTFGSVRSCAYRYSKNNNVLIHCTIDADGSLMVWRDDPANQQYVSALPVGKPKPANVAGPTKQQWLAHLNSMDQQQQFVMGPEYKHLFADLREWTPAGFTAFELTPGHLTVTRQSEKG